MGSARNLVCDVSRQVPTRLQLLEISAKHEAMQDNLRQAFQFILRHFEKGDSPYDYKPSHRTILLVVGALFAVLAIGTVYLSAGSAHYGVLIPVLVFGVVSGVCLVVGLLGSDRAVAKIWGQDKR
jgi:hypothetical protein